MSSAGFPINDLMRRKLQTGLTIATMTFSVAATLFLLFFSARLGVGITSATTGVFTLGLTAMFNQFIIFIGALIFIIGAILTSFIVLVMMSQRTRDFGLIKAVGCPNSLLGGYFMTELLTVTAVACVLGIALGFATDFVVATLVFSKYSLPNFGYALAVFAVFFVLSIFFGLRPILKAAKISAIDALSPVNYYGLTGESKHKPFSRRGITWRIALRSLYRRQSASLRITFLLSAVFVLLTVTIVGGMIAGETTIYSTERPVGTRTLAIGYSSVLNEYQMQLSKFSNTQIQNGGFNYSSPELAVPDTLIQQLETLDGVVTVDPRLVLYESVLEVHGISYGRSSADTLFIGGHRQGESMVVGVNPAFSVGSWSLDGRFLINSTTSEAVIGDSLAKTLYSPDAKRGIGFADPLLEGIQVRDSQFPIVGVCVDPLNNGYVTYVPIRTLQNATEIHQVNLVFVKIDSTQSLNDAISQITQLVQGFDSDLEVLNLSTIVSENTSLLASTWQTIMLLPLFTLASASICLVGFMMLSVNEQRQEFATLRAIGAKPKIIVHLSAIQCGIVLLSSFGVGISLGTSATLMILMANPLVTPTTIALLSIWLLGALGLMFALSLYPAYKMAKASILSILT